MIVAVVVADRRQLAAAAAAATPSNLKEVGAVDCAGQRRSPEGTGAGRSQGAKVELIEYGDLQCPVCKAYSEEVLPQVIENQVEERQSEDRLPQLHDHRAAVGAGRRRGDRRRRPGPRLELPRALLPQPGRGELRLRRPTNSSPRSPRAPASRTSPSGTRNARAPRVTDEVTNDDRTGAEVRLHRNAVVRDQGPEHATASNSSARPNRPRKSKKRSKRPAEPGWRAVARLTARLA